MRSIRSGIAAALVVCLGSLATAQRAPEGLVRLRGRVVEDDKGPFLGLGASLFWGVWGYGHDRPRLVQHLDLLRSNGFDFVRVFGAVANASWSDRSADPRAPGYDAAIAGLTDLAFEHGLRVAWTIFADTVASPSASSRLAVIDRFAVMAKDRAHEIVSFEIANEGWQNGFGEHLGELPELGRRLKARTQVLVTLTSPPPPLQCGTRLSSIYAPGTADFLTFHFDRNIAAPDGRWGPVRQILRWTSMLELCRGKLPPVAVNGEPIGPQSSVASEESPLRIVTGAVVTYAAGLPIYVLHTGPGVRGGGKADRAQGRAANLMDLPHVNELLGAFAAMKRYLPVDLPGWSRFDATVMGGPAQIETSPSGLKPVDTAAAHRGNAFVIVPFGIRDRLMLNVTADVRLEVIHPGTGARLVERAVKRGSRIPLPAGVEALVIIGRAQ